VIFILYSVYQSSEVQDCAPAFGVYQSSVSRLLEKRYIKPSELKNFPKFKKAALNYEVIA